MKVDNEKLNERIARFHTLAREAGIRLTHQRLEIFREVASSEEHPDAESVYRSVKRRMPTVSLDTVYRTLWMLTDLGIIGTLSGKRKSVRFDANIQPHHHFVCIRCGMTRDFEDPGYARLAAPEQVEQYGHILESRVEMRGICGECLRKEPMNGS